MGVQPTSTNVKGGLHVDVPDVPAGLVAAKMSKEAGAQVVAANGTVDCSFDTEVFDTDGSIVDLANDRFVVPATGMYLVTFTCRWSETNPVDVDFFAVPLVNGAAQATAAQYLHADTVWGNMTSTFVTLLSLVAGQFVKFQVSQSNGQALAESILNAEATIARVA